MRGGEKGDSRRFRTLRRYQLRKKRKAVTRLEKETKRGAGGGKGEKTPKRRKDRDQALSKQGW